MNTFRFSLGELFLATTLIACGCAILGYLSRGHHLVGDVGLLVLMGVDAFAFIGGGIGGLVHRTRAGILLGALIGVLAMIALAIADGR